MDLIIKNKLEGVEKGMTDFLVKIDNFELKENNLKEFMGFLSKEMSAFNFDEIKVDKVGNLIGVIKGYQTKKPLLLIANVDYQSDCQPQNNALISFKAGIVSNLYATALIKKSILPLEADLYVVFLPRMDNYDYNLRYLFEDSFKDLDFKGVILGEPTAGNLNIGHKGRFEYEIGVKGPMDEGILSNRGVNLLGEMFPLIHELEKVAKFLPHSEMFGDSSLRIKDFTMQTSKNFKDYCDFKILVDREFVPEENPKKILQRAKQIANTVYQEQPELKVTTALAKRKVKTLAGTTQILKKEYDPFCMSNHSPFVLDSLKALQEVLPAAGIGYWKRIVTDGAYTFNLQQIPTVGFGPGDEMEIDNPKAAIKKTEFLKSIHALSLLIHRQIGLPVFGWASDEI